MKFSIIVPCYNAEKWVGNCIESILKQNYDDWEMILINDGSTDNTINILYEYAAGDERIRVIDQKNQGVSTARNLVVPEAMGEYLLFLDSDDWYEEENGLSEIADSLENGNIDIVVFRFRTFEDDSGACIREELTYFMEMAGCIYTGAEYLMHVLSMNTVYQWFPFLYAFKKELWIKNNIRFHPDLFIHEDMDIIYQVILKAKRLRVLDSPLYSYRKRMGSASHTCSLNAMRQELDVCKNCIERVNTLDITDRLKRLLKSNFSYVYFQVLTKAGLLEKKDRQTIFVLLDRNRELMSFTIRKRNVLIRRMTYVLGLRFTGKLLFIRYKWQIRNEKKVETFYDLQKTIWPVLVYAFFQ